MELPDFLKLPEEDVAREKHRQERLRQEFNSRARLSPAEQEAGRAQAIEPTLRQSLRATKDPAEKMRLKSQLAEAQAAQGHFLQASRTTGVKEERAFYKKAAEAIFNGRECPCSPPLETVNGKTIRLPRYRAIKEVNSLKHHQFGYIVECNRCGNWAFVGSNPLPEGPEGASDAEVLRA